MMRSRMGSPNHGWVSSALLAMGLSAALVSSVSAGEADPPWTGGVTRSLGMPAIYNTYGGLEGQWYRPGEPGEFAGLLNFGVWKSLGSPVIGAGALGLEAYGGVRSSEVDGGGRAYFRIPSMYLSAGIDYGIRESATSFLLELNLPMRRGGILGNASTLDLRWLPGYDNTLSLGITFPLPARNLGETRPRHDSIELEKRNPERMAGTYIAPELEDPLNTVRSRASWIARLSQPLADYSGADPQEAMASTIAGLRAHMESTDSRFPAGHTLNEEVRVYHEALDRAFSLAVSEKEIAPGESTPQGRRVSAIARGYLLDDVLMPYNHLLGQRKTNDDLTAMIAVARAEFAGWLVSETDVDHEEARQAFWVFQTLCDIVEENRRALRERWEDSRFVWLPLQYGLKPEDHDSQAELNELIEKATQEEFSEGNEVWYIMNEEFQWEIARSVLEAEDYHVLWIHDIRGVNDEGNPDELAYYQVVNYLEALIKRVRAYDTTRKLPMYMIFLDQHYFELNKSRLWLRLLQEPLHQTVNLPEDYREWEEKLKDLQTQLRQAVDQSIALYVARTQFGEEWLKNQVKVHVNITNPADPSFYSFHVMGIIPVPDNMMRDHRKIAFYDITEEDPYRGRAMFTGMGIGEHYVGANWEDRAVMMRGPEALAVKRAAHRLLRNQGFEETEIPFPLRPLPMAKNYQERIQEFLAARSAWTEDRAKILQLHNQTGFRPKPIDAAKAVLYSLMPSGSVLKVPDSLWQSYLYASLLSGSALRGCRVLIISPTKNSAPSAGAPQLVRANGLMGRLIVLSNGLDPQISAAGGLLKIGLYSPRAGVGDWAGRFQQAIELKTPWQRRIYPSNPEFLAVARSAGAQLDSLGYSVEYLAGPDSLVSPKMHLKANLFVSGATWDHLVARPEWAAILRDYIVYLASQGLSISGKEGGPDVTRVPEQLSARARELVMNFVRDLPPGDQDKILLYLTVGSVNMDYRSMVMDGEAMITLAGWRCLVGTLDFLLLSGLCEWVETVDQLNALLPPGSGTQRSIAGLMKLSL